MVIDEFKCPKCGEQMEHGKFEVVSEGASGWFEPEILPWKEPPLKVRKPKKTRLFTTLFYHFKSEARMCLKCRLILFGY